MGGARGRRLLRGDRQRGRRSVAPPPDVEVNRRHYVGTGGRPDSGVVDVTEVHDKESLIQTLYAAVRYEEFSAYFYDRQRHKIPNREARIFFEVLSSEGKFHADILKRQIESVRPMHLEMDERGRTVEVIA